MARRPRAALRRGKFLDYPRTSQAVLSRIACRRKVNPPVRRGRFLPFIPDEAPHPPTVWIPPLLIRRRTAARIASGRFLVVIGEGAPCDCKIPRPNSGTTTRPGSGTTTRLSSDTTTRPCSCA